MDDSHQIDRAEMPLLVPTRGQAEMRAEFAARQANVEAYRLILKNGGRLFEPKRKRK